MRLRRLSPPRGVNRHHPTAPVPRCASTLAHEGAKLADCNRAGAVVIERDPHSLEGGLGQLLGREQQLLPHEALELEVGHLARAVVVHVLEQLEPRVMLALAARRLRADLAHAHVHERRHLAHRRFGRPRHLASKKGK
eukprot:scaffold26035_cov45-Phaeocystis_antarctica.AAC.1